MLISIFGWTLTISFSALAWNLLRTGGFRLPSDAGNGSDVVPPIVTTSDGTAYRDFRDPTNTWRDTNGGAPVNPQRQADLTSEWNQAADELRARIPPESYRIPGMPSVLDPTCNRDYTASRGWSVPRDPLVLDLDGDGIETVGINPAAPVLFDHDADGIKTGTGWIKPDDGLLVLDLNGNGTIDTGRELFGDNTQMLPGVQGGNPFTGNAQDGYRALRQYDSNNDGQINSGDAIYGQLRVWRDLNQDGISQAGELQTLDMREANKCVKVKRRETRKHAGIPKHFSNELIQIRQSDDINLFGWSI